MRKTDSNILVVLCLAIFGTPLTAATITGYVVAAASGEPLPVATVVVEDTDRGASTNLDGYFVIALIDPGSYTLHVSYLGYHSRYIDIDLMEGMAEPLTVEIERSWVTLEVATVTVEREDLSADRTAPQVSTVPVDAQIIRTMSSLGGEMDVLRALQTIPGVKASSDISSALHVRGGSTDQTLILMDHNTVYNPSHLFGIFSTFNADAVKHIELMKGGFPAEYGGRSGSVLEVIMEDGNRKKTEGLFSLGIVSARASLEGPLPDSRGSYATSVRRTYMEPIIAAMRTDDVQLPDYYFYDANGKLNLDLSSRTTLTIAGYWGDDRLDFEFGPEDAPFNMYMGWGNRTISGRLRHALGRNMHLSVSTALSRYRSKWAIENEDVLLDKSRNRLYDASLKSDLEIYHANHTIKTGFWGSRYSIRFWEESENLKFVDIDESAINYAVYVQDRWRINPFVEIKPGLRVYYHDAGDHVAVDPRFAMVYHYDPTLRFKIAGGRYTQFLNLATFGEGFSNFDLWIPVDESIEPPYSNQGIIGFEYDRDDGLEFTAEFYYTDMHNIASFDPMTQEADNALDAFVQGEGYAYGAEWMVRKKKGRLNGWFGYSLSWTRQRYQRSLINEGNWFYPKWDRRHDFIAVCNYKLSRAWDLAGSWRYNTGQGYTESYGHYTVYNEGVPREYLGDYSLNTLPGSKNNYRFPADHRLDVTFSWNHMFLKKPAKLNIAIFNSYSRRPYWLRFTQDDVDDHPPPPTVPPALWTEVTDVKLLGILPMLSYEVRF